MIPKMRKFQFAGIMVVMSTALAGCTVDELIPDPPGWNDPDWITEYHNFTLEDSNNSTLPIIVLGSNDTMFELLSVNIQMNETATNISYPSIKGYVVQDDIMFRSGYAPNFGNVTLHLVEMKGYDYNCTVVYREWDGGPYE